VILLISDSHDGSAALLADRSEARGIPSFRLNTDLLPAYAIRINTHGFHIEDPSGRSITLDRVTAALWRKPWLGGEEPALAFPEPEQRWADEQFRALVREIAALCRRAGTLRLVEPGAERRLNKLSQMRLAAKHWRVPAWEFTLGAAPTGGIRVVKALAAEALHHPRMRFLYATMTDTARLDPRYPWLVQDVAHGTHDATVVYLAGTMHGFRVARPRTEGPTDWRETINTPQADTWTRLEIPSETQRAIHAFMVEANLHYGRLDFIVDDEGAFEFLEVNSNGQFGWLDDPTAPWLHDRVLDAVLDPSTTIR
jgi:hypothetical protein